MTFTFNKIRKLGYHRIQLIHGAWILYSPKNEEVYKSNDEDVLINKCIELGVCTYIRVKRGMNGAWECEPYFPEKK